MPPEDMPEAGDDETARRLVPTRIELHQPGIAVKLERARGCLPAEGSATRSKPSAPNRSKRGWIANAERSDRIGYSSSTSSNCWFQ